MQPGPAEEAMRKETKLRSSVSVDCPGETGHRQHAVKLGAALEQEPEGREDIAGGLRGDQQDGSQGLELFRQRPFGSQSLPQVTPILSRASEKVVKSCVELRALRARVDDDRCDGFANPKHILDAYGLERPRDIDRLARRNRQTVAA